MKKPILPLALLFAALAGVPPVPAQEAERPMPVRLSVDFLNRDAQSVSLSVGRLHGINASMNFAVIDSAGIEVGRFYPEEILPDRFWSSPLTRESFGRVAIGAEVVRLSLSPAESANLRDAGRKLKAELAMARKRAQLEGLRADLADLDEEIADLKVEGVRIVRSREEIQLQIQRDRSRIEPKVQEYDREIERIRAEWNPLEEERRDLIERRDRILKRSSPSERELERINRDLADLDRKVAPLRERFNVLWTDRQELLESVDTRLSDRLYRIQQEEADNQAGIREIEIERAAVQREIQQLEREVGVK